MKKIILFGLMSLVTTSIAHATSFPGEILMRPQTGIFWQSEGFRLGTAGTQWVPDLNTQTDGTDEARTPLENFRYQHRSSPHAHLRIDVESLKGKSTLESYARRWVKEYGQYGFQILRSQPTKVNNHATLIYDLLPKTKELQIRQIIQVHHGKAVILTCSDEKGNFNKTTGDCNQMARNLIWNETARQ